MIDVNALIGLAIGLLIGGACRWFDLALPAPPQLVGALLVVMTTLGYITGNAISGMF